MGLKIKYFILTAFLISTTHSVCSQSNVLNAKNPSEIGERTDFEKSLDPDSPLKYGKVQDKDILFSKMIWEEIDVKQRVNFPYLYPTDSTVIGKERRPLIHYIRQIANRTDSDSITLYEDENGEFNLPMNKMAREKIWKAYILDEQGTDITDDPNNSIKNAIIDGKLKWPLQVPPTSHPEKSDASDVFLEKDSSGEWISREITEKEFDNYFNIDDDETGSLDIDGNVMSEEDELEMGLILNEILIDTFYEEGIHYEWERFEWDDVVSWKIKGLWYFDNILSELKYRIIGIAPVTIPVGLVQQDSSADPSINEDDGEDDISDEICEDELGNEIPCEEEANATQEAADEEVSTDEEVVTDEEEIVNEGDLADDANEEDGDTNNQDESIAQPLFWIFYPEIRKDLAKAYVFSERNSSVRKSFDELINARRFEAIIYREENVYEDRDLYEMFPKNSFLRLIESERIKDKVRNLEHDMWSW